MNKTIKATFPKGVIKPMETVDFKEGEEMIVTIIEVPKGKRGDPLDATFGGWADSVDCETLKKKNLCGPSGDDATTG